MTSNLITIKPTDSSGGGAVGGSGITQFTDASEVSLDGIFTPDFDSYRIEIDITSASAPVTATLRNTGTDDTAPSYDAVLAFGNAPAGHAPAQGDTKWIIAPNATESHRIVIELSAPALPRFTTGWADFLDATIDATPASLIAGRVALRHRAVTTFDGFTIAPSTATMTGTVRVLGYSN